MVRRSALALLLVVVAPGIACSGDEPAQPQRSEVSDLLEDRPTGEVEVQGAFFETTTADDGSEVVEVVLCDDVRPVPDVPDVPPFECRGESVMVPATISTLDLDWSQQSAVERFSPVVSARGALEGEVFEVVEVRYGDETIPVP